MNRLQKELRNRGIIGDNEMDVIMGRANVEWESKFVGIQNGFIVVSYCTNVLDPALEIYDSNFNKVASQALWLDNMEHWNFGESNRWDVTTYNDKASDLNWFFEM